MYLIGNMEIYFLKIKTMSKKEQLTEDMVVEALVDDGIMEEPDATWLLEYINTKYDSVLDTESGWAKGHEGLLIYTQSTADSYDLYVCTEDHGTNLYWDQDVYYYEDHAAWCERIIEALVNMSDVWVDNCIWVDMEYDFEHELQQWWVDEWSDLFTDKKEELLDSGEYDGYEEDK